MADDDIVVAVAVMVLIKARKRRMQRKHRFWVRNWLQNRVKYGAYHQLLKELRLLDTSSYRNFLRMDSCAFEELLQKVGPKITFQDTNMREAIPPGERLAVTLRFLATGETFASLKFLYRISPQSLGKIIPHTCQAIISVMMDEHLKVPNTEIEWLQIAKGFEEEWNFNNCIGALDGKHILIRPPPNSGSYYYNYKNTFSIVLMALVNASYKFIYVDVGCNGRVSDGGVFKNCSLYHKLEGNSLNLPKPSLLPGTNKTSPYVIVADDAFAMSSYLIKPYSQSNLTVKKRIFNYRLSRARRIVENAFGILSNRFRVFMTPISLNPEKVEIITLACCILHNFLRSKSCYVYSPPESIDREDAKSHQVIPGEWRQQKVSGSGMQSLRHQGSNNYSVSAKDIRDNLCEYYNSAKGAVSWQNNMI